MAPLLAGFSFALLGLVVQAEQTMRWPDLALLLLALAGVLLITVVQFAFRARMYQVTPSEAQEWWPDWEDSSERRERVYEELRAHQACHSFWVRRARRAYNAAICLLLLGVAVVLVPRPTPGGMSPARLVAVGVVLAALGLELLLLTARWLLAPRSMRLRRRLPLLLLEIAWWLASGNPAERPRTLRRIPADD